MMNIFIAVNITPIAMQVRDSLENKSMLLVHFKKAFPLTLLGCSYHLKEELADYCCFLKVTRVFPIPTQAKQTEDGENFAND